MFFILLAHEKKKKGLNDPNPSLDYNDEERRARRRGSQL